MIRTLLVVLATIGLTHAREIQPVAPLLIDGFESIDGWKAAPSDGVKLSLTKDRGLHGNAMRLDFDFQGHGGYAIAHKAFDLSLPANYEFSFSIRGNAPVNTLEFKLIDATGDNVWWSNQRDFVFSPDWKTVSRKKRQITFAWGPVGGGEIKRVAAIEFSVTAGTGGRGSVWLDDLTLTPLDPEGPYTLTPHLTASSSAPDHEPSLAMDRSEATSWRSGTLAPAGVQSLNIDFGKRREFGGLVIDWEPDHRPSRYTVSGSVDGQSWQPLYIVNTEAPPTNYLYLPESDARYLRINVPTGKVVGIRNIDVEPLSWSASRNDFFTAVARDALPGSYPKYLSGQQSYWTVLGVDADTHEGLVNEQGMLETGKDEFSIEPFVFTDGRLMTWRDVTTDVSSLSGDLPIKTVSWKMPSLEMSITTFAGGPRDSSLLFARYRIRNRSGVSQRPTLYLAIRPFQVNPPWQFLNAPGGVARIDSVHYDRRIVHVNADRLVFPLAVPSGFGAMSFDEGNIVDVLRNRRLPAASAIRDHFGEASAALAYDLYIARGGEATVDIAIPLHHTSSSPSSAAAYVGEPSHWLTSQLQRTTTEWQTKLSKVDIELPPSAQRVTETIKANLAYILINRDGPGIQPGSRSYERSWIRDGALTSTALLRLGHFNEVRDFIDWYAAFQFDNGKIPCCVDSRGADPVPENDSPGEFIYLIAEYYRHTVDRVLLERRWPNVSRAFAFMDSLRKSRMTPEFQTGDKRAFYGLLPQSISHEGYSAKPMHSYWDDFFALRGFKDAAEIARILSKPEAQRYAAVRDEFRHDLYASIKLAMSEHHIDYIPGSVELGDFDATSTTIAVAPVDELANLPEPALDQTFQKYYDNFIARRDGRINWENYTPYELRVIGTFVHLGQKKRAHDLLDFFFHDQRPAEWRQWAEVVWKNPATPKFIGDMPHTWVGSDYIRSILDMFAYERESDSALVIGAGIPESWVREKPGVRVSRLSTHYGRLDYTMQSVGNSVRLSISGVRVPPGGIVIRSPLDRPIRAANIDGRAIAFTPTETVIRSVPANVTLEF
jgi:F5/8 type C domain